MNQLAPQSTLASGDMLLSLPSGQQPPSEAPDQARGDAVWGAAIGERAFLQRPGCPWLGAGRETSLWAGC